ncbi:MAG: DoxX family protein [Saprospiraceae bacterium]
MNKVTVIGKYLFAFPFVVFGVLHLMNASAMSDMVSLPGGVVWVYVSGLAMLLAGVAVLIGRKDAVATFLLGLLLLVFVLLVHLPSVIDTNGTDPISTSNFLKDLALSGAAFVYSRSAAKDRTTRLT